MQYFPRTTSAAVKSFELLFLTYADVRTSLCYAQCVYVFIAGYIHTERLQKRNFSLKFVISQCYTAHLKNLFVRDAVFAIA